ncbi:MAG TPA: hypothetical protein VI197_35315, partial [Polyangiaceae bacterium]
MNCEQLRDRLLQGRLLESNVADAPEVRAHAAECSACHELLATRTVAEALCAPDPEPLANLSQLQHALRADLAHETGTLARLKSLPTRTRLMLALALMVVIAVVEGTLLARAD